MSKLSSALGCLQVHEPPQAGECVPSYAPDAMPGRHLLKDFLVEVSSLRLTQAGSQTARRWERQAK
jgi:hypothetical protein